MSWENAIPADGYWRTALRKAVLGMNAEHTSVFAWAVSETGLPNITSFTPSKAGERSSREWMFCCFGESLERERRTTPEMIRCMPWLAFPSHRRSSAGE